MTVPHHTLTYVIGFVFAAAAAAPADDVDPRGVYFHEFTGSLSGAEWLQVIPADEAQGGFEFRDIGGGGANGLTTPAGVITLYSGGSGGGSFSDPDHFALNWSFPGGFSFQSTMRRVDFTTSDFPLELDSATFGDPDLSGEWNATTTIIDGQTGEMTATFDNPIAAAVNGTTLNITTPDGAQYRGVFETPQQVVFRIVQPTPPDPRYRTISGCLTSLNLNILGEATIDADAGTMSITLLRQTRAGLGQQEQTMVRITANRSAPCAPDFNGDGAVDAADLATMLGAWGPNADAAPDLDDDGVVGAADLAQLLGMWGTCR